MYYQMGNFVPWREAAWALLAERLALTPARRAAARFRLGQVPRRRRAIAKMLPCVPIRPS